MDEQAVRAHFIGQAKACDALGSPFTARLCRSLAKVLDESTRTGRTVLGWTGDARADALALRLCGTLFALVLTKADEKLAGIYPPKQADEDEIAAALTEAISRSDARIAAGLSSAPQTNEIARSAMLLPGFLMIARETGLPLELNEIGASAGLNLLFDRFHYRYGDTEWGDAGSPVSLITDVRGNPVPIDGGLVICHRAGCDIAPIDVTDPQARLRLRSYVWADQPVRLQRLDAALSLADRSPPPLKKEDAATFVVNALENRREDNTFVLSHSIMWQYLPEATRRAVSMALEQIGGAATKAAPLAWLRMEPLSTNDHCATLSLTLWPGGQTRALARCDYHGRWIEWLG